MPQGAAMEKGSPKPLPADTAASSHTWRPPVHPTCLFGSLEPRSSFPKARSPPARVAAYLYRAQEQKGASLKKDIPQRKRWDLFNQV